MGLTVENMAKTRGKHGVTVVVVDRDEYLGTAGLALAVRNYP
jgi:hypothetical protein